MKKKNALWAPLVILLFFSMAIAGVAAQEWTILVYPASQTVDLGETFTVYINVTDVVNIYGYEFRLYYDTNRLDGINITFPGTFFPTDPTKTFVAKQEIMDDFNATTGRVWLGASLLSPEPAKNGTGTLVIIYFNATAVDGPSSLKLSATKLYEWPGGTMVTHTATSGEVTVIPEFPAALITPLFMVLTLVAIILGKVTWSRKRRNSFIAR